MIKRLLGPFLALVALFLSLGYTHHLAYTLGQQSGVDSYHKACYTGGYVVDEQDGTIVMCQPLTILPEKELQNFLDNGKKVMYNKD